MEPANLHAGGAMTRAPVSAGRPIGHVETKLYRGFIEHLGRCIHGGIHDDGPLPLIRSLTATRSCCTHRQHSTSPWRHSPRAMSQRSRKLTLSRSKRGRKTQADPWSPSR
jgi:hypothetical protein